MIHAALDRLASWQTRRPGLFLLGGLLVALLALPFVSRLRVNGDLTALLPDSVPSVRDLDEIQRRFGQPQTFVVLLSADSPEPLREFARIVAPRFDAELRDRGVVSVDWNILDYRRLIEDNAHLWIDIDQATRLRDAIRERLDYEKAAANPFFVALEDPPTALDGEIEALRERAREAESSDDRFSAGFFEHTDHKSLSIFLRTDIRGGDMGRMQALLSAARDVAERARADLPGSESIQIDFGGSVMDMHAEQEALADAAITATLITIVLVLGVILIFFLRFRALVILPLGLLPPVLVTFGITGVLIQFLNASSAFLSSIVIGNGINPHIVWLARYFEERRSGKDAAESLAESHRATWRGTLTASMAAAFAYASLIITDFRAFRDFGIIGAIGMVLCWFGTFLMTPALAVVLDRIRPMKWTQRDGQRAGIYGRFVERLAIGAPRAISILALCATVLAIIAIVPWVMSDPIEYDFRNLQSQRSEDHLQEVNRRIAGTAGASNSGGGIALLVNGVDDVPHVRAQLEAFEAEHPQTLGKIMTIWDLLPDRQEEKLPILRELRALMIEARPHLNEEQRRELDEHLPPETIRPLTPADLPEMVARPFTEIDGTRGTILYVEHDHSQNEYDGRYLIEWTSAVRGTTNLDGTPVRAAGAATVVADLVRAILTDGPKTVVVSFLATLFLLVITFRRGRDRALVYLIDLIGVGWMIGCMAAFGMKVNFLNFLALPVTFGIGVDYGVNVMWRYVQEESRGASRIEAIRASIRETGGAVILCSLTTVIGYIALYTSPNQAVNSFGGAMSLAEITCLGAAVIVLPAVLTLLARRARERSVEAESR